MSDPVASPSPRYLVGVVVAGIVIALVTTFGALLAWYTFMKLALWLGGFAREAANPEGLLGPPAAWAVALVLIRLSSFSIGTKKAAYIAASILPVVLLVRFYNPSEHDCELNIRSQVSLESKRRDVIVEWAPCIDDPDGEVCLESDYQNGIAVIRQLTDVENRIRARRERFDGACVA
jgi:hypothetical protein